MTFRFWILSSLLFYSVSGNANSMCTPMFVLSTAPFGHTLYRSYFKGISTNILQMYSMTLLTVQCGDHVRELLPKAQNLEFLNGTYPTTLTHTPCLLCSQDLQWYTTN
jgi:hypothetical protein